MKTFFLRDRWIGIEDIPRHYQQFLESPEEVNEEYRAELLEDIRQWRERGDFVLHWDEDYYFDRNGAISSS